MKNRNIVLSMIALLILFVSGCAVTDIDREVNFNGYRKYAWKKADVDVVNPIYESDLINKKIETVVQEEFAKKGIVLANNNKPDFFVNYNIRTEKKQQTINNYQGLGYYPFWGLGWGWRMPYMMGYPSYGYGGMPYTREYTQGTLILDVVDAHSNKLVWRGSVSGNVDNVKNLQRQIEKGVKAIMKKYPGQPGENHKVIPDKEVIG
jgi:hypothetical protein